MYDFLFVITELFSLALTVEALQGKTCQDSLLSGGGRSLGAKISGRRGRPWRIFFGLYKTRHILLIVRSAVRWYLIYSEADFEVATRCIDGSEIRQFHPHRCNGEGIGPPKLKFLLRFDQNVEYKRPAGACPLRDFHKICRVCTLFQDVLAVKISWDLLKGLRSYRGFKLMGSGYPQIFSSS